MACRWREYTPVGVKIICVIGFLGALGCLFVGRWVSECECVCLCLCLLDDRWQMGARIFPWLWCIALGKIIVY